MHTQPVSRTATQQSHVTLCRTMVTCPSVSHICHTSHCVAQWSHVTQAVFMGIWLSISSFLQVMRAAAASGATTRSCRIAMQLSHKHCNKKFKPSQKFTVHTAAPSRPPPPVPRTHSAAFSSFPSSSLTFPSAASSPHNVRPPPPYQLCFCSISHTQHSTTLFPPTSLCVHQHHHSTATNPPPLYFCNTRCIHLNHHP